MKESFAKITAWIKAHPIPSAIIGLVIVVVGYFVVRSSGGNSSGETIDGGSLGAEESSPLVGLGGGDMSTGSTTSTGTTPAPIPAATGETTPAYNDISTPQAAESIGTFAPPSDYINTSGIFSGPTSAAAVVNNLPSNALANMNLPLSTATAPTNNKNVIGEKLVSKNTGQPVKPVSGGGIARTLAKLTAPIKAPSLASIKPVTKPVVSVNSLFSGALLGAGKKATPTPYKAGYTWDAKRKIFVKIQTVKPLKAY